MAEIKLTKSELRLQQQRLNQLQKYLPTLQLKKAMLQAEVSEARTEIQRFEQVFHKEYEYVSTFSSLFSEKLPFNPKDTALIKEVHKRYENIAGVEVPFFESVSFQPFSYSLFDTPPWVDALIISLQTLTESKAKIEVVKEKKTALENELREVSIRVNLFEKILIPRANRNIKKIKVFLGDQQLAAVSQAKVAKTKIEERVKA